MKAPLPGQRWISDTETEQGLGTLLACDEQTLTLLYPATGETRLYRRNNSPLTRVEFEPGETVSSHEGWTMKVTAVAEDNGLLVYTGTDNEGQERVLQETDLDHVITLSKPRERLLFGRVGTNSDFSLRYRTLMEYARLHRSPWLGLAGARVSLIDHQLYIAREVANHPAPRALLADEPGLGKTIEAGLVIRRQLLTGRASRILILVPDSLLHQWLVELLRRFYLHFTLYDEERCQAKESSNPFVEEQLVLCSLDWLCQSPTCRQWAQEADWDLLVVDEAHHLTWTQEAGGDDRYTLVEALAQRTPGALLLTATPEQHGTEGHFARLRLLDPARFHKLDVFLAEQARYEPVTAAVCKLMDDDSISDASAASLTQLYPDLGKLIQQVQAATGDTAQELRDELIRLLLDRYGTGSLIFRNTRASMSAFPERHVIPCPLPLPDTYKQALQASQDLVNQKDRLTHQIFPELAWQHTQSTEESLPWWKTDPRIHWLINLVKTLRHKKILVICARDTTALDLVQALRVIQGIQAGTFHKGMSLVERDRAAAWFADEDYVTPLLVCSEIGSEGRNFQFAHHLVLFDLPLHPDLLEQRIGRLDRIGQQQAIQIHIPFLEGSAQQRLFQWYQDGLNAFAQICPAGAMVYSLLEDTLHHWLCSALPDADAPDPAQESPSPDFVAETRTLATQLNHQLHRGRDRLLELNASGFGRMGSPAQDIASEEHTDQLGAFLERLGNSFGLDIEDGGDSMLVVRPGTHMTVDHYPGLPADGTSITLDRQTALAREDVQFVSWEHPMILEAMETLLTSETGNAACSLFKGSPAIKPGIMLLEAVFVIQTSGERALQLYHFLPPTPLRILVDPALNNLSEQIRFEDFDSQLHKTRAGAVRTLVRARQSVIGDMLKAAEEHARKQMKTVEDQARQRFVATMDQELARLTALQQFNPNIRDKDIESLQEHARLGSAKLAKVQLRLDAVRLVLTA